MVLLASCVAIYLLNVSALGLVFFNSFLDSNKLLFHLNDVLFQSILHSL